MIHLHTHSCFSIGDAVGTPEQLVQHAKSLGHKGLGISEHGNLASTPRFIRAANEAEIKPVIGIEAYFHDGDATQQYKLAAEKNKAHRAYTTHLLIGALNRKGYENLVALNNLAQTPEHFYYIPRTDWNSIAQYSEGLYCTSSCASGLIGNALIDHCDITIAERRTKDMKDIFEDRFYLEIQPTDYEHQDTINQACISLSKYLDIPLITTCDIHYPTKDLMNYRTMRWAIDRKKKVADYTDESMPTTLHLQSAQDIMQLYDRFNSTLSNRDAILESIANTDALLDKIQPYSIATQTRLPLAVPGNPNVHLRYKCVEKLEAYNLLNSVYLERLLKELTLIINKDFSNYFLIVADMIAYAKKNDIVVGPGRGSATGSLVSYLLNITSVDPIKHNLLFERFLSEDREELPDIDVDIQDNRRYEVIEYFMKKYGNVHNVATYHKFKPRGLLRDCIRIMDIPDKPPPPGIDVDTVDELMSVSSEATDIIDKYPLVKEVADNLSGQVRHVSRHAGGFVISQDNMLPLINIGGEQLSSWIEGVDYRDLSDYGFVKFDILGVTALSVIGECCKHTGVIPETIPIDDSDVLSQFARGYTDTIFQFNSWKTKEYLREMHPTKFEDLVAVNALIRPGASDIGMDKEYIRRKNKPSDAYYFNNPAAREVLGTTYGILLYQEQLTQLAAKLGGVSLADAEKLRKEIVKYGKSDIERKELDKLETITKQGFINNGLSQKEANTIWENFKAFERYGFTRNHSYPYSLVAYWQMWFRINYPGVYFYSYCKFENNDKNITKAIQDSGMFGIRFLRPEINKSDKSFSLESSSNIRFGLTQVEYVGDSAAEEIINNRPYADLEHFKYKTARRKVNSRAITALANEGAFDEL